MCGCRSNPAADALRLEDDAPALRRMQTRRFQTSDEAMIQQSSAALLQDLGFSLDESESEVGLILASKERTAVEPAQVAGAIAATIILTTIAALLGSDDAVTVPWDERQHMRICLVTRPVGSHVTVRVTFQRMVWNNEGRLSKREPLQVPKHYEQFFERLSEAVFLEAHQL